MTGQHHNGKERLKHRKPYLSTKEAGDEVFFDTVIHTKKKKNYRNLSNYVTDFQRFLFDTTVKEGGLIREPSINSRPTFYTCTVFHQPQPLPEGALSCH